MMLWRSESPRRVHWQQPFPAQDSCKAEYTGKEIEIALFDFSAGRIEIVIPVTDSQTGLREIQNLHIAVHQVCHHECSEER